MVVAADKAIIENQNMVVFRFEINRKIGGVEDLLPIISFKEV
jgi:hypothetical protein